MCIRDRARACRKAGFTSREWEIQKGPEQDLTRPRAIQEVCRSARKGLVISAMLAPPCTSFSVARDRTAVIRDRMFPWGRPDTSPKDTAK
eukprot:1432498-Prorocentrum_lima.AAC.1